MAAVEEQVMKNAEHPFTPADVQAWIDGEFGGEEANALQAHVASCAECSELAASIRTTSSAMQHWQIDAAPASLGPPVMQQPRRAWLRWAAPVAAALLLAAVVIWPGLRSPTEKAESFEVSLTGVSRTAPPALGEAGRYDSAMTPRASAISAPERAIRLQSPQTAPQSGARGAMVVRTATLELVVADVEKTRTSLDQLVKEGGGFVSQMETSGRRGEARWLTATLRVQEQRLTDVITALKK